MTTLQELVFLKWPLNLWLEAVSLNFTLPVVPIRANTKSVEFIWLNNYWFKAWPITLIVMLASSKTMYRRLLLH